MPSLGVVAISLSSVAILYAPFAWVARPDSPAPANAWAAVVALGILCTAIAFIIFFALIADVGPAEPR